MPTAERTASWRFCRRAAGLWLLAAAVAGAHAGDAPPPQALPGFGPVGAAPQPPWQWMGLPHQSKPRTEFSVVEAQGHAALRVDSDNAYGNLVLPLPAGAGSGAGLGHLVWQWKLERLNSAVDLHTREGDDTNLKVCVMWDLPLDRVPFFDRQVLRLARAGSPQSLPTATVCYVWDAHLREGTVLDNAYTRRLRYVVLHGASAPLNQWTTERRDIAADFLQVFGDEAQQLPPLLAVGVGADSDNTHGHSTGYVAELQLLP